MAEKRLFGGVSLGDIARGVKERSEGAAAPAKPVVPAAELALTGRVIAPIERESIFTVDPKRVRPWRHHDRGASWYTRERCLDLIESIAKDGQLTPAVGRKVAGDPNYDYELISGMRRRFACEHLNAKLRLRLIDADDARAAVLMHVENADRQDITPMERALAFQGHLDAKLFSTQDALAEAMGLSKGQVAKMLKAASLLKIASIAALLPDVLSIPVKPAYKLAALLDRNGAKDVVLQAAQNMARTKEARPANDVLKQLLGSLDHSRKFTPLQKAYNVGATGKVVVKRNQRGKVTLAFPSGIATADKEAVLGILQKIVDDLGR